MSNRDLAVLGGVALVLGASAFGGVCGLLLALEMGAA